MPVISCDARQTGVFRHPPSLVHICACVMAPPIFPDRRSKTASALWLGSLCLGGPARRQWRCIPSEPGQRWHHHSLRMIPPRLVPAWSASPTMQFGHSPALLARSQSRSARCNRRSHRWWLPAPPRRQWPALASTMDSLRPRLCRRVHGLESDAKSKSGSNLCHGCKAGITFVR